MADNIGDAPKVSVVTPSFNQGPFLEETLQSVLRQTYPNVEYLVIDAGSSDSSVDIIRSYGDRIDYWVSEPDRGQSHGINKGLARSSGSILGWLNSDDTLMPDAVSRVVEAMDGMRQGPKVVHGSVQLIDTDSEVIARPKMSKRKREFGPETLIDDGLVNQPGTFWNREAISRVGYLREDLHYIMDYDLWVRMALVGTQFQRLDDPPLATYRLAGGTKTVSEMNRVGLEKLELLDQLMADPSLPVKTGLSERELRRRARRAGALAHLKVGRGCARTPGRRAESMGSIARAVWLWPPCVLLPPEYLVRRASTAIQSKLGRETPSW